MNQSHHIFTENLLPDEKIVWSGQPTLKLFTGADIFLVPFSIVWSGFVAFWEITAIKQEADYAMALFGVPFIAMGLYILFGRFFYKLYRKKHTYYALTDKRALVSYQAATSAFDSVYLDKAEAISKSGGKNGVGTIRFGQPNIHTAMYANTGMDIFVRGTSSPAFYDIAEVDRVYRLAVHNQQLI